MISIIDLKLGNIGSVIKSLAYIGCQFKVIANPSELIDSSGIILPGVGSFSIAAMRLNQSGFTPKLKTEVLINKTPFLGICVGMQLLATYGEEGGKSQGLGFIKGIVTKLNDANHQVRIPHTGWNDINVNLDSHALFKGVEPNSCFYFVHSYAINLDSDESAVIATTNHGEDFISYLQKDNIFGVQFHPEKSQTPGLTLLRNFINLC